MLFLLGVSQWFKDKIKKKQSVKESETPKTESKKLVTGSGTGKGGTGSTGKLTGSLDGLTSEERAVINELLDAGNDVEIIPRSNIPNSKTPDFYVNGVKTELKTLFGSSLNTPVTRIQEGFAQGAENVIIDARKTGMTLEEATKVIERVLGIYSDKLPGTIEIWTIEGILRR